MIDVLVSLASSVDEDYAFLVPITALFWRDVVGHIPRVHLVGSEQDWSRGRPVVALRALSGQDIDFRFVDPVPGHNYPHVAQNVRQHAACDPALLDSQWIMPADADLWPLRSSYYHQHEEGRRAVLLYANGDHFMGKSDVLDKHDRGGSFQSIPTCHAMLRARDWRQMYGLSVGDLAGSLRRTMDDALRPIRDLHPDQAGWIAWMSDQWYMTERLCRQSWFPEFRLDDKNEDAVHDVGEVRFVTRRGHPPLDRLCRSVSDNWSRFSYDSTRWTDAHLPKGAHRDGVWDTVRPIVAAHLPQHAEWVDDYRERWVRA